jgi:hypothetical protein
MTGDAVPVVMEGHNYCHEFGDPRAVTYHGYKCSVCATIIYLCHDAALLTNALLIWEDPCATLPPAPDTAAFDLIA